ncbi:MAG: hypothetical protein ACP6IP_03770 [Candidatus Njordarchaeia archaeon]
MRREREVSGISPIIMYVFLIIFLAIAIIWTTYSLVAGVKSAYVLIGYASILLFALSLLIAPRFMEMKLEEIERQILKVQESIAIEDIIPIGNIVALKPARLKLKIKNPLETFGLRLRFRSYDYINPSSLELLLEPGERTEKEVIMVPSGSGRREFSVSIAKLYDENNKLIPEDEADDLALQKFALNVEEPVAGGLSSRERSILSGLIKFAAFFSASGLVYLSILKVSGMESLMFVLTQVVPLITLLQVPVLMLMFYLDKKLPEKPTFIFEEEE